MGDVCHEQAFVEGFLACDPDATSTGGVFRSGIDADIAGVAVVDNGTYEACGDGGAVVVELYISCSRVFVGKGCEIAEEGALGVGVGESIACYAGAKENSACHETGDGA